MVCGHAVALGIIGAEHFKDTSIDEDIERGVGGVVEVIKVDVFLVFIKLVDGERADELCGESVAARDFSSDLSLIHGDP